jgi:ribonucleoside-triphosphate reductase
VCVEFPVKEPYFMKGKKEISMWEQLEIAAQYQHYWADNSVSVTVTFKPDEAPQIKDALEMYETRLKAVSFLKYEETGYEQAPYEPITKEQYETLSAKDHTCHDLMRCRAPAQNSAMVNPAFI